MVKGIEYNDSLEIAKRVPFLKEMDNTTLMVTGSTGLIGRQIVKAVLMANEIYGVNIRILALARNAEKFASVFHAEAGNRNLLMLKGDINNPIITDEKIDYIIHAASVTASKDFVNKPVETIKTAMNGTQNVLEFAREKEIRGCVYLSSLEVYGTPDKTEVTEADYGYIDFLSVRSSYSEGKRMVECMCNAYASEYDLPIKIARLTQTMGAGIEYSDNRVFAQFAKSAIEKKNIVLNTPGRTVRNYCYITDAVTAVLTILLKGDSENAYNVANKNTTISIADMARLVCDEFAESGIEVVFNNPDDVSSFGYNPEMKISLVTDKIESLGWSAHVDLVEMYHRLVDGLKEKL